MRATTLLVWLPLLAACALEVDSSDLGVHPQARLEPPDVVGPQITVHVRDTLEFGDEADVREVTLRNLSDETVVIRHVALHGDDVFSLVDDAWIGRDVLDANGDYLPLYDFIAPGGTLDIEIAYEPTHFVPPDSTATLVILTNAPLNRHIEVDMYGGYGWDLPTRPAN